MLEEDDKSNIKIDIEIFKKKLKEFENRDDLVISKSITNKYDELIKTYNCFNMKYDPKSVWEKKRHKTKNILYTKNKLYTFTTVTKNNTINDTNTKNIIGFLNKITENNKIIILKSIEDIISENNYIENNVLLNIVFNYIEKKYDIIYINILKLFEKKHSNIIYDYINDYILLKKWLPYNYIISNNILDDNLYNEYCDYIKWKKKEINYIKTFIYIINEEKERYTNIYEILCDNIFDIFNNYLTDNYYTYLLDYTLELLYLLLNETDNNIINNLKKIDMTKIDNSTKFIIYNIIKK